ncbi:aspartate/glutamate racemase family protein [Shinella sp. DD12]|uniref:aspartate/glutamate racemase family protein n=2 Tax=unclassified Shinella TaxID=2643062 RepID=UPI001FDA4937|nr:aspartate/glutamate racemase family protein [Shinella sp. DD12]
MEYQMAGNFSAAGGDVGDILVINPNSSTAVTRSMAACLEPLLDQRHAIRCVELSKSPPGIETDAHVAEVIPHLVEAVRDAKADAIVVSCFSDPGIDVVRAVGRVPVTGIAEAAYLAALGLGARFGIVSLGPSSIARHRRYLEKLKLDARLAGDRSIDMTIVELIATNVVERVSSIAVQLRDTDGADVIILGCAGLGSYRAALQDSLGLPVIDPVQAGVALACTHADLRYAARAR